MIITGSYKSQTKVESRRQLAISPQGIVPEYIFFILESTQNTDDTLYSIKLISLKIRFSFLLKPKQVINFLTVSVFMGNVADVFTEKKENVFSTQKKTRNMVPKVLIKDNNFISCIPRAEHSC